MRVACIEPGADPSAGAGRQARPAARPAPAIAKPPAIIQALRTSGLRDASLSVAMVGVEVVMLRFPFSVSALSIKRCQLNERRRHSLPRVVIAL